MLALAGIGGLGLPEIIGIVIIVLVIFGAGRLAGVGGALGRGVREFKQETKKPADEQSVNAAKSVNGEGKEKV